MENLLAEMDCLISELTDVARDYQRMAQETAEELAAINPNRLPRISDNY